ncbi:hypothetical protein [Sulfuricurvum sp.]|uniref:hypothetical protein n=1 Tax=Sulfuricurvum sp. TaxID=2025608 RepID=UPI003BB18C4D
MATFITVFVILAASYWIVMIISRKQKEVAEKELYQREQFLKETQSLLKTETPSYTVPLASEMAQTAPVDYCAQVSKNLSELGYTITKSSKAEGIDLIGLKEKELLLVRCESTLKEIRQSDLKGFIADCSVYIDNNPMLTGRSLVRCYATNRPITEEAQRYLREYPMSLRLFEENNIARG